jgi:hypothetical protein
MSWSGSGSRFALLFWWCGVLDWGLGRMRGWRRLVPFGGLVVCWFAVLLGSGDWVWLDWVKSDETWVLRWLLSSAGLAICT